FQVPDLPIAEETKRKHLLERVQRTAVGELVRDVDDTLDNVESIRVEKSEDRVPAANLKDINWDVGHPDREKNLLKFEQRKRYDEWNTKPSYLHRRHMRHLSVVVTMQ
ncbi:hypothetical protein PMAYCL1PPCAC_05246, partial [Pristionchus mayeri]